MSEYWDFCQNIRTSVGISGLLSEVPLRDYYLPVCLFIFTPYLPTCCLLIFSSFTSELTPLVCWRMCQQKIFYSRKKKFAVAAATSGIWRATAGKTDTASWAAGPAAPAVRSHPLEVPRRLKRRIRGFSGKLLANLFTASGRMLLKDSYRVSSLLTCYLESRIQFAM